MSDSSVSGATLIAVAFTPLRLHLRPGGLTLICPRREATVGRHSSADIRLPLPDVSRQHARLRFDDDHGWVIHDLESLNGVEVNGRRVDECVLRPFDRVRIGVVTLEVDLPAEFARVPDLPGRERGGSQVLRGIAAHLDESDAPLRRAG